MFLFGRSALQRPLDLTVVVVVFVLGLGQLIATTEVFYPSLVDIISIYFIIASIATIIAIVWQGQKHVVYKFVTEMFGWLFISGAAYATSLIWLVALIQDPQSRFVTLTLIWLAIATGSGIRAWIMRNVYKNRSIKWIALL